MSEKLFTNDKKQAVEFTPAIPICYGHTDNHWPIFSRWLFWERNEGNQIIIAFDKNIDGCLLPH